MWGAATFGWLCVETDIQHFRLISYDAATFGWLCVETNSDRTAEKFLNAATFGWLCVETTVYDSGYCTLQSSHLRGAVC